LQPHITVPGGQENGDDSKKHQERKRNDHLRLLVVFTVTPDSDEHRHDQGAIRDEIQSWLESLNADVKGEWSAGPIRPVVITTISRSDTSFAQVVPELIADIRT
jgi:hypothetical protein